MLSGFTLAGLFGRSPPGNLLPIITHLALLPLYVGMVHPAWGGTMGSKAQKIEQDKRTVINELSEAPRDDITGVLLSCAENGASGIKEKTEARGVAFPDIPKYCRTGGDAAAKSARAFQPWPRTPPARSARRRPRPCLRRVQRPAVSRPAPPRSAARRGRLVVGHPEQPRRLVRHLHAALAASAAGNRKSPPRPRAFPRAYASFPIRRSADPLVRGALSGRAIL